MITEEGALIPTNGGSCKSYVQTIGTGLATAALYAAGGRLVNYLVDEKFACSPVAEAVFYSCLAVFGFGTGCGIDCAFSETPSKKFRAIKALAAAVVPQALLFGAFAFPIAKVALTCDTTPATGGLILLFDGIMLTGSGVALAGVAKGDRCCQGPSR